jgi:hypothetical protein
LAFTSQGLGGDPPGDLTPYYHFQYEETLATPEFNNVEPTRTFAAEFAGGLDFNMMQGWFGGIALDVNLPIAVNVTPYANGASWNLSGGNLVITLHPGRGDQWMVRYLLVAEMVEQFMRAQGKGWFGNNTEGSVGEGLSQFLAAQFVLEWGTSAQSHLGALPPTNFEYSNYWLASNRLDYVSYPDRSDRGRDEKSACSLLFIYYLHNQLNFSIEAIVAAGAPDLVTVYQNLTGSADFPFAAFKQLLDTAFPGNKVITSGNLDNPFPIASG